MTVIWCGAFVLAVAAFVGWRAYGRFYAPVPVYCGMWAAALVFYAVTARAFAPLYPLDERTVTFYVVAALMFALGSACISGILSAAEPAPLTAVRPRALQWIIVAVVLAVPAAYLHVRALFPDLSLDRLLFAARYVDTRAVDANVGPVLGPFANLAPFSMALTLVLYASPLPQRYRWMRIAMLLAALATTVLAGGRAGGVTILISVFGLAALRGNLNMRTGALLGLLFLTLFFAVGLLVGKGGASVEASASQNARLLLQGFRDYALGGVIGFQRILLSPGEVASTGGITRTVEIVLNHLGGHFEVPSLYSAYTTVGYGVDANVYTLYYSYMDYGLAATFGLVFTLGGVCAAVYSRAIAGWTISATIYATFLAGMVTSVFNESFYTNVNFLAKLVLCGLILLKPIDRSQTASA